MRRMKIPPQDFELKMQGSLCARGAYLQDTTVCEMMYEIYVYLYIISYAT